MEYLVVLWLLIGAVSHIVGTLWYIRKDYTVVDIVVTILFAFTGLIGALAFVLAWSTDIANKSTSKVIFKVKK